MGRKHPDLCHLSAKAQNIVWWKFAQHRKFWRHLLWVLIFLNVYFVGLFLLLRLLLYIFPMTVFTTLHDYKPWIYCFLNFLIVCSVVTFSKRWIVTPVYFYVERNRLHKFVIERYVRDGRFTVCLECDYDLRGSRSETCPECGTPVAYPPKERCG
jgi:uncharacterized paraquat-inducible protein A